MEFAGPHDEDGLLLHPSHTLPWPLNWLAWAWPWYEHQATCFGARWLARSCDRPWVDPWWGGALLLVWALWGLYRTVTRPQGDSPCWRRSRAPTPPPAAAEPHPPASREAVGLIRSLLFNPAIGSRIKHD